MLIFNSFLVVVKMTESEEWTSLCYLLYNNKSVLHIGYRVHKHAYNWYWL